MKLASAILLSFFVLSPIILEAQSSIGFTYNDVHIGRNFTFNYGYEFKKSKFYGGLKIHLNRIKHDNQNNLYYKRFYTHKPAQHIGANLGYNYNIRLNERNNVFLFYDNQFTVAGTRGVSYLPYTYVGNTVAYTRVEKGFEELKVLEQYIGFGLRANLINNLYFKTQLGLGYIFYFDVPSKYKEGAIYQSGPTDWELGKMFSFGLEYEIPHRKKKARRE